MENTNIFHSMKSHALHRAMTFVWQFNLFFFCIGLFSSKSGLTIFGSLLLIHSLFRVGWANFRKEKILVGAIGLYLMAAVFGLFSMSGANGAIKILYSWPWPLLVIPAYVVYNSRKDWPVLAVGLFIGLVGSTSVAIYNFFAKYGGDFTSKIRVTAFWDMGRWGIFLAVSCIVLVCLQHSKNLTLARWRKVFDLLFVLAGAALILSNSRGPWLALILAFIIFCFLPPRRLKYLVVLGAFLSGLLVVSGEFRQRFLSAMEVHWDEGGKITSVDNSNAGRLHMWKVALDFFKEQPWFGTGFRATEAPFRDFLERQPVEYKEKYVYGEFSYTDQHSSYLTILVEMGVIYFFIFWGYFALVLKEAFFEAYFQSKETAKVTLLVLVVHLFIFIFYRSVQSYEMASLFPFLVLLSKKQPDYKMQSS